jgi:hypothetical protein
MPFTADSSTRANPAHTNSVPDAQAYRADQKSKSRLRREQHEKHLDRLNEIALGLAVGAPANLSVSIAAAREFGDRVVGKPIQTNINANVDDISKLSDNDLRAELERLGGNATSTFEGTAPEKDQE